MFNVIVNVNFFTSLYWIYLYSNNTFYTR